MRALSISVVLAAVTLMPLANNANAHGIWFAERSDQLAVIYGVGADDLDMVKRLPKITNISAYDVMQQPVETSLRASEFLVVVNTDEHPAVVAAVLDNGYWSKTPDGEWIAFYAKRGLYKAKISGGSPFFLAETPSMAGACWLTDGTIVFTMAWNSGLFRISENGGEPTPVLIPDREDHYAFVWPHPFPGEKELIFNRWGKSADLMLLNLMDGTVRALLPEYWRRAIPTQSGHILFTGNGGDLLALPGTPAAGSTQASCVRWAAPSPRTAPTATRTSMR